MLTLVFQHCYTIRNADFSMLRLGFAYYSVANKPNLRQKNVFVLQDHLRFRLIKSLFSHPILLIIFCKSHQTAYYYYSTEPAGPAGR